MKFNRWEEKGHLYFISTKTVSKSNLLVINGFISVAFLRGKVVCSPSLPSPGSFSKCFSSPLTVQNRCSFWPAPRTLLLNPDSTIPHGVSSTELENDFNPQQNLCCCQSNLSPKESILFAALFSFLVHAASAQCITFWWLIEYVFKAPFAWTLSFVKSTDCRTAKGVKSSENPTHNRSRIPQPDCQANEHEFTEKIKWIFKKIMANHLQSK